MIIRVRLFFYYLIEVSIRTLRIEDLVAVHHCYEVFLVAQVDDVMGVAGEHLHGLNLLAAHFVVPYLIRSLLAKLDKAMT